MALDPAGCREAHPKAAVSPLEAQPHPPTMSVAVLLAAIFSAAACALVYELLIGSTSSYFLGDAVAQYSLTIGIFLFAMGLGSWLSRWVHTYLVARFIAIELWLGVVGGFSVAALYWLFVYTRSFRYGMMLLVVIIGGLIGMEVPLLTRQLRQYGPLRTALSSVMSLDYLGSLVAALLFPYVLLPTLGALHTAAITGLVNVAIGSVLIRVMGSELDGRRRSLVLQALTAGGVLVALLVFSNGLRRRWEDALYADHVVYSQQSTYQRIVLTQRDDHIKLFLDNHLQFASVDEYRYHEALVHPAMALAAHPVRVLIIGGGDGLAAREVLKYPLVEQVDLVDLDPAVTGLAQRQPLLVALNADALNRSSVRVINEDGFVFLQHDHAPYGVIILDLPDPREESLAKLYSVEAYRLCRRALGPGGVVVTQGTSPYFSRHAYWCIGESMKRAGFHVYSYQVTVPSFGPWGFHLGSVSRLDTANVMFTVATRYLDPALFLQMQRFPSDMARVPVRVNRLDRPLLADYYRKDWQQW